MGLETMGLGMLAGMVPSLTSGLTGSASSLAPSLFGAGSLGQGLLQGALGGGLNAGLGLLGGRSAPGAYGMNSPAMAPPPALSTSSSTLGAPANTGIMGGSNPLGGWQMAPSNFSNAPLLTPPAWDASDISGGRAPVPSNFYTRLYRP